MSHPVRAVVTRVETIPLRVPFRTPFKISSGAPRPVVETLLVRLHTDAGPVGVGETQAWRRDGSSETQASLVAAIEDHLAPRVVGRSPFELAAIMHGLDAALSGSLYAKAPIGDALYDLQGQLLGVPVHALLGGKCRDHVEGCEVLSIAPRLADTIASAERSFARGFRAFTVKIGNDPRADLRNVAGLRERFGTDAILRADANAGLSFDDALWLLKRLEPYDLDCVEQPVALWDVDGMAELARRVDIPLMADECVASDHDLIHVVRQRAATVVQTKIAKNGGIWHSRKLWAIAAAAGMRIYPGNHPSTSVATAAVVHMAAAWPGPLLEGPFAFGILSALGDDVVADPLRADGARVIVPDAPGLGVTLDEAAIARLHA